MAKLYERYYLAKPWIRIIARLIDMIINSILVVISVIFVISFFKVDKDAVLTIVSIIIYVYLLLFLHFVLLPWWWNGQTIGKKICRIKIVSATNNTLTIMKLWYRELFLLFIPFTLALIGLLIQDRFFKKTELQINKDIEFFLTRCLASIIIAWYLGILIVVKIDQKHQLFFDRNYQIYLINITPVAKKISKNRDIVTVNQKLKIPGNISDEQLQEINDL